MSCECLLVSVIQEIPFLVCVFVQVTLWLKESLLFTPTIPRGGILNHGQPVFKPHFKLCSSNGSMGMAFPLCVPVGVSWCGPMVGTVHDGADSNYWAHTQDYPLGQAQNL